MTLNAWGLICDLIGVALLGISAQNPFTEGYLDFRRVIPQWGGHMGLADKIAKWCRRIGWLTLILGLTLQFVAEIVKHG